MKIAAIPANEILRQEALEQYHVLDSLPEKNYDDLTFLAASICRTPIALISLIDHDRQWFKSKSGINAEETPRDISFCSHAINQTTPLVVTDASLDERFQDNPFVTGPLGVRFYAGAPLITPDGYRIGTLCVIDQKARNLSAEQIESLSALARQVISQLELRKNLKEVVEAQTLVLQQQQTLAHYSKMSALGEMTGRLAHEINNPLAIIMSKSELIRHSLLNSEAGIPRAIQDLEKIEATTMRISKIVRGMSTFNRECERDPMETVAIRDIVEDTVAFCKDVLRDIKIPLLVDELIPFAELSCRPSQLSQVILNLIINARDAIRETAERWIKINVEVSETQVSIRILDSGKGIDQALQAKIFQPFFTTKPPGKGTGLGLSIAEGLIRSNGGTLQIDHLQPNTCFLIQLPKIISTVAA